MSVDMFLKIEGVEGEAADSVHGGEIDVLSWSWGMSQSGSMHIGGGGGAGKVAVQDLSFTKYIDSSSPNLMNTCCTGKHYPEATLTVRKAGGDAIEYYIIVMEEVIISSISTGAGAGDDRLVENVSLNFSKFTMTYTPQSKEGNAEASIETGFNIEENVVL
ncbi:MAG: type VI secretion system tube protein Hcp [Gammaproteobacteria bacterium]|nr:MAG: type VI secretion system tube protein Hcp [Gammaproteobacteria bacterium]